MWSFLFKFILFFILSTLIIKNLSHAIVGGVSLKSGPNTLDLEKSEAKSFVKIEINLPLLPTEPCSGSFIGHGWILTAMHCLIMNDFPDGRPQFCFSDYKGQNKECYRGEELTVFFPNQKEKGFKTQTRMLKKIIEIQIPDLALIKLPESKIKNLTFFQIIKIPGVTSPELNKVIDSKYFNSIYLNTFIAGQGGSTYNGPWAEPLPGLGEYRIGHVTLNSRLDSLVYSSTWSMESNNNSGPVWGDSGGPLYVSFLKPPNETERIIFQIGVISNLKRIYNKTNGQTTSVTAYYSRLDDPEIISWLQNTMTSK